MERRTTSVRDGWEKTVETQGLIYHHTLGRPYWNESAYYEFTSAEVDALEAATNELQARCLDAAQHVIDTNRFAEFGIPPEAAKVIIDAWNAEPPAIYGRFDLMMDRGIPKMLEYNADTPTGLIEAALIQWFWKEDRFKDADQFNSIHERLIAKWRELAPYLNGRLYFAALPDVQGEDMMTASYMRDTAIQAGLNTEAITVHDIGWNDAAHESLTAAADLWKVIL